MIKYLEKVGLLTAQLHSFEISHIPRAENAQADALSRLATSCLDTLGRTYIKHLETPSVMEDSMIKQLTREPSWMDPLVLYLIDGSLPNDDNEAHSIR